VGRALWEKLYGEDVFLQDVQNEAFTDQEETWYFRLIRRNLRMGAFEDDAMTWFIHAAPNVAPDDPGWERFLPKVERLFPKKGKLRGHTKALEMHSKRLAEYRGRAKAGGAK